MWRRRSLWVSSAIGIEVRRMTDMRTERGLAAEAYHPKADTQGVIPEADRCPRGGGEPHRWCLLLKLSFTHKLWHDHLLLLIYRSYSRSSSYSMASRRDSLSSVSSCRSLKHSRCTTHRWRSAHTSHLISNHFSKMTRDWGNFIFCVCYNSN